MCTNYLEIFVTVQLLVQETGESVFLKSSQVVSKVLVHTFSGKD